MNSYREFTLLPPVGSENDSASLVSVSPPVTGNIPGSQVQKLPAVANWEGEGGSLPPHAKKAYAD